jgi:hypothetical protein
MAKPTRKQHIAGKIPSKQKGGAFTSGSTKTRQEYKEI